MSGEQPQGTIWPATDAENTRVARSDGPGCAVAGGAWDAGVFGAAQAAAIHRARRRTATHWYQSRTRLPIADCADTSLPMSIGALNQDAPFAGRGDAGKPARPGTGSVRPVRLGPLTLSNRYFLAPLAGVSDWPFRLLCREMGASIAHTEMISSHGLVHGGGQRLSYLERPIDDRPFAIQVFGHDPGVLAEGARIAVEKYGPIDAVDINMGCPVKKVCCHGAGAAMLKDPVAVERPVRKVADSVGPLPVTVKL